jgi:Spy/CpxP family protein refolding chaperone
MMSGTHRHWLIAFVFVVFAAGVAAGVLADNYINLAPNSTERGLFPPPPETVARMLADDLELTAAQRAQLDAIVAVKRRMLALRREDMRQRFEQDANSLATDIRQILTPAQQQKFDEIIARVRSRFLKTEASLRPRAVR